MKQTLIKITDDRYVVVTDEPIEEGDSILMNGCIIRQCDYVDGYMIIDTTQGKHHASVCKKITHSTQPNKGMENVTFISPREVKEYVCWLDETQWEVTFDEQGKLRLV